MLMQQQLKQQQLKLAATGGTPQVRQRPAPPADPTRGQGRSPPGGMGFGNSAQEEAGTVILPSGMKLNEMQNLSLDEKKRLRQAYEAYKPAAILEKMKQTLHVLVNNRVQIPNKQKSEELLRHMIQMLQYQFEQGLPKNKFYVTESSLAAIREQFVAIFKQVTDHLQVVREQTAQGKAGASPSVAVVAAGRAMAVQGRPERPPANLVDILNAGIAQGYPEETLRQQIYRARLSPEETARMEQVLQASLMVARQTAPAGVVKPVAGTKRPREEGPAPVDPVTVVNLDSPSVTGSVEDEERRLANLPTPVEYIAQFLSRHKLRKPANGVPVNVEALFLSSEADDPGFPHNLQDNGSGPPPKLEDAEALLLFVDLAPGDYEFEGFEKEMAELAARKAESAPPTGDFGAVDEAIFGDSGLAWDEPGDDAGEEAVFQLSDLLGGEVEME
ncbi:hypothetical protein DFJ74DRAFT_691786 [Hyaloraphidium curvatum]|nr:hypothetical protein DFJ74DRAFT_691786 [Hyaloraphidium curvatum]